MKELGINSFLLGTTHSGKAGRYNSDSYVIESPNRNFFESWVKREGHQNAYIDFSSTCDPNKQFRMKSLMHQTYFLDWFKLYDGVIYLENSSPCSSI